MRLSVVARRAEWMIVGLTVLAPGLAAQPVPLEPDQVVSDADNGHIVVCPVVEGRPDGGYAVAWAHTPSFGVVPWLSIGVAAPQAPPQAPRFLDQSIELPAYLAPSELRMTATGWTLTWLRGYYSPQRLAAALDMVGERLYGTTILPPIETMSPRPTGGFVAVRRMNGRFEVQLRDPFGNPARPGFVVPDRLAAEWTVHHRPDGRFVVLWNDEESPALGITALRFDADGRPTGRPFAVAPPLHGGRYVSTLSDDGTLAVAFSSPSRFQVRTYDERGRNRGVFRLAAGDEVDALAVVAGRVFLVWRSHVPGWPLGLLLDSRGTRLGPPFQLASTSSFDYPTMDCARVAAAGSIWVVTWVLRPAVGLEDIVMSRRFAVP